MTQAEQQQALNEVYAEVPDVQPSDAELSEMFDSMVSLSSVIDKIQNPNDSIPNLPRGFGQR